MVWCGVVGMLFIIGDMNPFVFSSPFFPPSPSPYFTFPLFLDPFWPCCRPKSSPTDKVSFTGLLMLYDVGEGYMDVVVCDVM